MYVDAGFDTFLYKLSDSEVESNWANVTIDVASVPTAGGISGFKINDTNDNGKWDAGEKGIYNILLLAATNEPWAIEPALRRPGRLKKLVFIPPPDLDARKSIFEILKRQCQAGDHP